MMSSSVPYTVPKPPGTWPAIFLAILVHAVLFAFLWIGINWVNNTPETIDAEVWSTKELEQAPPPVVTPPPPPPEVEKPKPEVQEKPQVEKPDIALEEEKKRKKLEKEKQAREEAEQEKKEAAAQKKKEADEKKQKELDDKHKQEVDAKLAKKLHDEDVKRMMGETPSSNTSGTAAHSQGNSSNSAWVAKVTAKVKSNIVGVSIPSSENNDPVEYVVGLLPDGSVAGIRKNKSSGIPTFDDAVKRAIEASQPYPADSSGRVPSSFISKNYPKDQ
jgi:colicin import membrane protein